MSDIQAKRKSKARILVVDDHPLVREGLAQLISRQADLDCCGETDSVTGALEFLSTEKADLVTVDIRLTTTDGLELLKTLRDQHPDLPALVISQCDELIYAERALKAGAKGYVMKERATDDVLQAIRTVLAGGLYVSPKIATLALNKMVGAKNGTNQPAIRSLTDRELQILQLLGAGLGTSKIAARLFLSVKTVETHRENIKHKLGLADSAELVCFATEWLNGLGSRFLQ